jgi:GTP cyclohydrolase I
MVDHAKVQQAVRMILEAVGEDPEREGLRDTPARVARMYEEIFQGLHEDPSRHLQALFDEEHHEVVLVKDISFHSMCEHHLMPFHGRAHVAYIPGGKILGISKVGRIVDAFSRRPQVQERLTSQVADFLARGLEAKGVAVVLEATHTCMTMRGVRKPESSVVTSALRGSLLHDQSTREEVLSLIQGHRAR